MANVKKLFAALSDSLHKQLRLVSTEKEEMVEEAERMIVTIKQMEASLEGADTNGGRENLIVSYPLNRCLQALKAKRSTIAKIHKERFEQVKKLVEALESYSSHLEPGFVRIALPPISSDAPISMTFDISANFVTALDGEFTRVYEEYTHRVDVVRTTAEEIIKLWAELGTPQVQTDTSVVNNYRDSPEQLGLHQNDLKRLAETKERLLDEKRGRERRLKDLKTEIAALWDKLGVEEHDSKQFLNSNRGCGLRAINEFEDELARLQELKRQNLHLFVEDARYQLQELWDALFFSEEEMLEFTPAFSDVYSDALLSSHEAEIARLEALKEQRAPILQLVEKHRSLVGDRTELAASSQDASRLMLRGQKGEKRDPTRLLREEKMRKRIAKELPKVEADLRKVLETWEEEYGRPFCVLGERYLDELTPAAAPPSASRHLPPRSKTPSNPPTSFNRSTRSVASGPRPGSALQGPTASRYGAKTPTPGPSTLRRNPLASSTTSTMGPPSRSSPSKIPARVPLGNMPHGTNSPERGAPRPVHAPEAARKMAPPTRAPPPKMRELFAPLPPRQAPPKLLNSYDPTAASRCESVASSLESVRPISPDDVYSNRPHASTSSYALSSATSVSSVGDGLALPRPYAATRGPHTDTVGGSRQPSGTSSATTNTVSGSENWETYDDASEPEPDATEAYYTKLRAARGKRFTPDGGHHPSPRPGPGKKIKSTRAAVDGPALDSAPAPGPTLVEGSGGRLIAVSGSEAGWTDEDAF
ncbi:MAG: hypothetical protein M1826_001722 [Phylliscum demangeonii]|nr:MAG: hypothetical protein M1826_001722 [Phylliscum demangeonii]